MPCKQCRALTRRCQAITRNHARLPRSGWRTRCWTPGTRIAVLLSGATRSGTGTVEPEPSPSADFSGRLRFEARVGTIRRTGIGFFQPGWKPGRRKSGRASPITRASIPCICSPAGCRGAERVTPARDGNWSSGWRDLIFAGRVSTPAEKPDPVLRIVPTLASNRNRPEKSAEGEFSGSTLPVPLRVAP